jgi:hypothetical protein
MTKAAGSSQNSLLRFDRYMSRLLFGNSAGTYRLKYGNYLVRANRGGGITQDGSWENGYKKIGAILDPALVDRIVGRYQQLIDDPNVYIRRGNLVRVFKETGQEYNRIVRGVARHIPEINEIPRNPRVKAEIEAYFGSHFTPASSEAWRNWHLTEELERRGVLSNHWHHDSFRADTVKLYMLLHDTNLQHGPFHFLDADKSRKAVRASKDARIDKDVPDGVAAGDVHLLTGKKGDLLLINTIHCLHRAGNPQSGQQRDILEMRLQSSRGATGGAFDEATSEV